MFIAPRASAPFAASDLPLPLTSTVESALMLILPVLMYMAQRPLLLIFALTPPLKVISLVLEMAWFVLPLKSTTPPSKTKSVPLEALPLLLVTCRVLPTLCTLKVPVKPERLRSSTTVEPPLMLTLYSALPPSHSMASCG